MAQLAGNHLLLGANVFITGANRGIGLGLVREMLKVGGVLNLFAGCRDPEKAADLQTLANSYGAVRIIQIDVNSDQSIRAAVSKVDEVLTGSGLNLLVNNSGVLHKEGGVTLQQPDRKAFMDHFEVNTVGAVMTTAAFLPMLRKAASDGQITRVVNISSILGSIAEMLPQYAHPSGNYVYGMSKAALNHYTKALAMEEPELVSVAIHPGWVQTDMGGPNAMISVEDSCAGIVRRICALTKEDSGKFLSHERELRP